MITTSNLNQARKEIQKSRPPIIVKAQALEFNRKILEYGKFQTFVGLDKPLNHVMAKLATKNKIAIALDLKSLPKDKKQKAKTLSTVIQNLRALKKTKTKISLLNTKNEKDAKAFLQSLGASTQQTNI